MPVRWLVDVNFGMFSYQLWFVSDFTCPRRLRDRFRQQFRRLYSHGFLRCGFYWRCNVDYMPKQLPMDPFFWVLWFVVGLLSFLPRV